MAAQQPLKNYLTDQIWKENQILVEVTRRGDRFDHKELEPVHFVPLLGGVVR